MGPYFGPYFPFVGCPIFPLAALFALRWWGPYRAHIGQSIKRSLPQVDVPVDPKVSTYAIGVLPQKQQIAKAATKKEVL